jgi:hypothetical protein
MADPRLYYTTFLSNFGNIYGIRILLYDLNSKNASCDQDKATPKYMYIEFPEELNSLYHLDVFYKRYGKIEIVRVHQSLPEMTRTYYEYYYPHLPHPNLIRSIMINDDIFRLTEEAVSLPVCSVCNLYTKFNCQLGNRYCSR